VAKLKEIEIYYFDLEKHGHKIVESVVYKKKFYYKVEVGGVSGTLFYDYYVENGPGKIVITAKSGEWYRPMTLKLVDDTEYYRAKRLSKLERIINNIKNCDLVNNMFYFLSILWLYLIVLGASATIVIALLAIFGFLGK